MSNSRLVIVVCLIGLVLGCSSGSNSGEIFSEEQGHPKNWSDPDYMGTNDYHATAVLTASVDEYDYSECIDCHGAALDGGTSAVSCYACHNGPDGRAGHPAGWRIYYDPYLFHDRYAEEYLVSCSSTACHGEDLTGGTLGPSCFTSECHNSDEAWNIYYNEHR